jgi:hypothetical protein
MTTQTTNKPNSFIFYRSFFETISDLEDKQQLEIYKAIAEFSLNDNLINLDGISKTIFRLIQPQLLANKKRYLNGLKGAEHGIKGGRPKTQDNPLGYLEPQDNHNLTPNKPLDNPKETPNITPNKNKNKNKNDNNNLNLNTNENNNLNNKPNKEIHVGFENDFQELWQHYTPVVVSNGNFTNKGCKQTALNSYKKARAKFSHQKIMDCLELYLKECQKNNRYTKNVATWINQSMQDGFKTHEVVLINAEPPKPAFLTKQQQLELDRKAQEERLLKFYSNQ